MRIQILDYQVGPHTFRMVKPSDFNIFKALPSLIPFITTIDTTQKVIFETEIDDDETATKRTIAKTPDDICFNWEDADCIIRPLPHSSHLVSITPRKSGKNYWMECNDNFRQCFIHLPACRTETPAPENETNFVLNNFLMMLYAFNAARHHTLLMHASVVATETGKGYLFLGKSGTGKSTHTGLWLQQFSDCHLLNDDNPIVHVDSLGKQATVFGSPWSGKTPCYRKESMTVGAFVRLEQAPQNEIEQERAAHAFATLLPSCSCLKHINRKTFRDSFSNHFVSVLHLLTQNKL